MNEQDVEDKYQHVHVQFYNEWVAIADLAVLQPLVAKTDDNKCL